MSYVACNAHTTSTTTTSTTTTTGSGEEGVCVCVCVLPSVAHIQRELRGLRDDNKVGAHIPHSAFRST